MELARCREVTTWTAPWVIIPGAPPIRHGAISVDANGELVAVGRATDFTHVDAVETHGVIMPGLCNAHTHLELAAGASELAAGDGLVPWIMRLLAARASSGASEGASFGAAPSPDVIARNVAAIEALGTVAVGDVTNSGATIEPLRRSSLCWRAFLEVVAPRPGEPVVVPARAKDGRAVPTAHSTYATREDVLVRVGAASVHVEEDPAEADWLLHGEGPFARLLPRGEPRGARPVEYLDRLGLLVPGTLLVHMTCAEDDSFGLAARRGAVVVLCPRSNLAIGGRTPRWRAAREAGCRVALGTDSLASAPSLDLLGDVAVLARAGADPAWLVSAATVGGARALGLWMPPGWIEVGDAGEALRDPVAWLAFEGEHAARRRLA